MTITNRALLGMKVSPSTDEPRHRRGRAVCGGSGAGRYIGLASQKPPLPLIAARHCSTVEKPQFRAPVASPPYWAHHGYVISAFAAVWPLSSPSVAVTRTRRARMMTSVDVRLLNPTTRAIFQPDVP